MQQDAPPPKTDEKEITRSLAELQARGASISHKIHGVETPDSIYACCDAGKDCTIFLTALFIALSFFIIPYAQLTALVWSFFVALIVWKFGRATFLAATRLARLHRVAAEEKDEIEHNRTQEREELRTLYRAKGFDGQLLEDVVDVLMADGDRLLRVMLQEEMGFLLEETEHPLIQGLGAAIGAAISCGILIVAFLYSTLLITIVIALIMATITAVIPACYEKNRLLPISIWTVGIAVLTFATIYYMMMFCVSG